MKRAVLILGATSSIARSLAVEFAKRKEALYLASRDVKELERIASDLYVRYGAEVKIGHFDAEKSETHAPFLERVLQEVHELKGVVAAFGIFGSHEKARSEYEAQEKIFRVNLLGACSILSLIANHLEKQGSGFMIGISSVSGEQARATSYFYNASKGGLSLFLQGLRFRFLKTQVKVLTVKPGYVDTAMSFGQKKKPMTTPEHVARETIKALDKGKSVVYVPKFWRYLFVWKRLIHG